VEGGLSLFRGIYKETSGESGSNGVREELVEIRVTDARDGDALVFNIAYEVTCRTFPPREVGSGRWLAPGLVRAAGRGRREGRSEGLGPGASRRAMTTKASKTSFISIRKAAA
jgi:hypothetical protein